MNGKWDVKLEAHFETFFKVIEMSLFINIESTHETLAANTSSSYLLFRGFRKGEADIGLPPWIFRTHNMDFCQTYKVEQI